METTTLKTRILLVDDDEDDRDFFRDVVSTLNVPVEFSSATDGVEALDILKAETFPKPDLIFLDLNMPRMNGRECLQQLKGDKQLQGIPIIVFTTSTLSIDKQEMLEAGATGYLSKPTAVNELNRMLTVIVESLPHSLNKALSELRQHRRFG